MKIVPCREIVSRRNRCGKVATKFVAPNPQTRAPNQVMSRVRLEERWSAMPTVIEGGTITKGSRGKHGRVYPIADWVAQAEALLGNGRIDLDEPDLQGNTPITVRNKIQDYLDEAGLNGSIQVDAIDADDRSVSVNKHAVTVALIAFAQ